MTENRINKELSQTEREGLLSVLKERFEKMSIDMRGLSGIKLKRS